MFLSTLFFQIKKIQSTKEGGNKSKRSPPDPFQCIFNSITFPLKSSADPKAIYLDVPKRNGTHGRFIAFNNKGRPKKFNRRLKGLKLYLSIGIRSSDKFNLRELIKATTFECRDGVGCRRLNKAVRSCLSESNLTRASHLRHKNIFKKIQKCIKSTKYNICMKRLERNGHSIMRQDSKQRNHRALRTSNSSSNSMEASPPHPHPHPHPCAHLKSRNNSKI